ncbi:BlaI/MecI/CopY family transcriptional regulator [Lunatibacter salilacus]|uniref:BlaI/MecI/CopY family transcriptional regulator n=1 Tax=Lunatibacter salilacus TaxID=2483804 RepID=UPI00131ECC19|nr:BlaI/MecI/CopY family transcriptional regulator [Lunatibacter salilacus]
MKELTRAEEQVMQILWDIERGFVKDLLAKMQSPKPAYNTISTIVRILERKGFVDHQAYGKSHEYFPIVSKDEYRRFSIDNLLSGYFSGSFANLASFFAKDGKMELQDLERILEEVKEGVGESN